MVERLKWTEDTKRILEGRDDWVLDNLNASMKLYSRAKVLEIEFKDIKAEGKALAEVALEVLGLNSPDKIASNFGTISAKVKTSYSTKTISEYLLAHGVSATVIKNAMEAAKSESPYVEFRKPSKKLLKEFE